MISYRLSILSVLGLAGAAGCIASSEQPDPERTSIDQQLSAVGPDVRPALLAERAAIAASGRYLARGTATTATGSTLPAPGGLRDVDDPCPTMSWSDALDIPGEQVIETVLTGSEGAAAVRRDLGVITPRRGQCFALLSTGLANHGLPGSPNPEPGTDLPPAGVDGDKVTLRLKLIVPRGANLLTFQYNFLSAESPDFTGTQFNDTFSVDLTDSSGVRSVEVASVNSSEFFDASESRARGTGFDLFTPDPAGVDINNFTGGLPDAGLTDFHVFVANVIGGTELQLALTIQDNGDGLLDSAVLIDAVEFSALQVVDPNPRLVIQANQAAAAISQNVNDLVSLGSTVRGVVADGTTELVLRMKAPRAGNAEISLPDGDDGTLRPIDAVRPDPNAASVTRLERVPAVMAADEQRYILAVYRAPWTFDRDANDKTLVERTTQVQARFTGDDGSTFETTVALQIRRPPVVLVRGLWTQSDDWFPDWKFGDRARLSDPAFVVNNPVFSVSQESGFYSCDPGKQVPVPRTSCAQLEMCKPVTTSAVAFAVQGALDNTRRLGIAATKVDVVAHGTGGLRVRQYIEAGYVDSSGNPHPYKNPVNLLQGDINRLITVNTPHLGMRMANRIVEARDRVGSTLDACAQRDKLLPIEPGDLDFAKGIALPATEVPSHAIFSTGGFDLHLPETPAADSGFKVKIKPKLLEPRTGTIATVSVVLREPSALYTNTFGRCDNDLMVDVVSQQGGIAEKARTEVPMTNEIGTTPNENSPDSDHFRAMRSPDINRHIQRLLTSPPDDGLFATFPATADLPRCNPATGEPAALAPAIATSPAPTERSAGASLSDAIGGLRIVSPADGSEVFAGDRIVVQVESNGGFVPVTVMTSAEGAVVTSNASPFTTEVAIPPGVVGPLRISAIGFDANDEAVFADDVTVQVRTAAVVQAVRIVTQNPILYASGERYRLSVFGDYDDDRTRSITTGAGTVYLTSNPAVVTVSREGVLTAVRSGTATVIAQNGGAQDSITATVKANVSPVVHAEAGAPLTCNLPGSSVLVRLDGSASFDPDGDPLAFTWFENGVALTTGPTAVVAFGVGVHPVELIVSDGISPAAHGSVTVSILADLEPPVVTVRGDNPRSVECAASYSDDGATASDTCDGDLSAAIVAESHVDTAAPGSYTVDYQVRDQAGLIGAASRAVVVADHTPPQLSVVGDNPKLTECGSSYRDDGAVASDACDGDLTAAVVSQPHVNPAAVGSYAVDYQVHDRAGLTSTISRSVLVADRTPPQISVLGDNPATTECGGSYHDEGAVASDACDGDLTAAVASQPSVDPAVVGSYAVEYQVHDGAGQSAAATRSVIVADRTPPQISLRGASPAIAECGLPYTDGGATAVDACDGDLTAALSSVSHVDPGVLGGYTVAYDVRDRAGLTATAQRSIIVADRTPPQLSVSGDNPAIHECGTAYRDAGATASDLCAGDLTSAVRTISLVNAAAPGIYPVGYSVHDAVGRLAAAFRIVRVVDRTPPSLAIAPMQKLFPADGDYRMFDLSDCASAIDACHGPLSVDQLGEIIAIHSDERDTSGHGDLGRDIVIVSDSRFKIRNQASRPGNGRVYEIEFAVHDTNGNTTGARSCFIGVKPSRNSDPVNDGRVFTVRPH